MTFAHVTDADRLLTALRMEPGQWVGNLYHRTGCMVHSRIANLRARGYQIECRRFGKGDYRYRLVSSPTEGART